jgi:serine protease Do
MAILKMDPKGPLPEVDLGHSDTVAVSNRVMIVGNPDGKRHTVTYGEVEKATCGGGTQIHVGKADIGPGFSGGPIFNALGQAIAQVHVKIWTMHNASRNIRVDHLRKAFAEMVAAESRHGYKVGLKVDCQADQAVVTAVGLESPAGKAGLKTGDILTKFGAMNIKHGPHYAVAIYDLDSDKPVEVEVCRGEKTIKATVVPTK